MNVKKLLIHLWSIQCFLLVCSSPLPGLIRMSPCFCLSMLLTFGLVFTLKALLLDKDFRCLDMRIFAKKLPWFNGNIGTSLVVIAWPFHIGNKSNCSCKPFVNFCCLYTIVCSCGLPSVIITILHSTHCSKQSTLSFLFV